MEIETIQRYYNTELYPEMEVLLTIYKFNETNYFGIATLQDGSKVFTTETVDSIGKVFRQFLNYFDPDFS